MPTPLFSALIAACLAFAVPALADPPAAPPTQPKPPAPTTAKPDADKKPDSSQPVAPAAPVPNPKLKPGDKAPAITADVWVKGDTIAAFDSAKVYVVEFWATWCPSCREAMPHLAKRARASKDLVIIAVASSERKDKNAEDKRLDGVKAFVKDHDEQMPYAVLFDGTRAMATDWLVAANQRYLPFVFIVDSTGIISWQGDPRRPEFDAALDKALAVLAPPPPPKPDPKKTDKPKARDPKPKG